MPPVDGSNMPDAGPVPALTGDPAALAAIEEGTCARCGQTMLRATRADGQVEDVWHPHDVPRACPEQPTDPIDADPAAWSRWYAAGNKPGRPGFEHFRPTEQTTEETP